MANEELREKNIEKVLRAACRCFLAHGIEHTTQEMLVRESGASRASINRYFANKVDSVQQTIEWIAKRICDSIHYSSYRFDTGERTGREMLRMFMEYTKTAYINRSSIFVLWAEYRIYIFRNGASNESRNERITENLGCCDLLKRIYAAGVEDGSFPPGINVNDEAIYCYEGYFGYLANLAMRHDALSENVLAEIDYFIERFMAAYDGGR